MPPGPPRVSATMNLQRHTLAATQSPVQNMTKPQIAPTRDGTCHNILSTRNPHSMVFSPHEEHPLDLPLQALGKVGLVRRHGSHSRDMRLPPGLPPTPRPPTLQQAKEDCIRITSLMHGLMPTFGTGHYASCQPPPAHSTCTEQDAPLELGMPAAAVATPLAHLHPPVSCTRSGPTCPAQRAADPPC